MMPSPKGYLIYNQACHDLNNLWMAMLEASSAQGEAEVSSNWYDCMF
jgi:hypothetical protein